MAKKIFSLFIILIALQSAKSQELPKFKDGQTVCFIGNSITQAGTYHMLFQAFYATRFPENTVKFISCGVSGDNASGMIERFNSDVLIHKPDYAFLMTGMNDMFSELFAPGLKVDSEIIAKRERALDNYCNLTNKLAELLVANNIKPILLTPSIYDETVNVATPAEVGKNEALEKCAKHIRWLGKKYTVPVVDLNPFMLKINQERQKTDPSFTLTSQDRVHPGETGHFIMAYKIINTLFPPEKVSSLTVDSKKKAIVKAEKCEADYEPINDQISFNVIEKSLPFPITKAFVDAQRFVPFIDNYNQEMLQVLGLKKGQYVLQIDGTPVDTLTAKDFASGVNIALNHSTPQYKQAEKVFGLCTQYHDIQSKLRIIVLVSFRNLKNYNGSETIEAKKAFLAAENEKSKGKSWYEYNIMVCEKYFEYQSIEKDLWSDLERVRNKIYMSNIPIKHNYRISKLN